MQVQVGNEKAADGIRRSWDDVFWLAGWDIRRAWQSYPGSALYLGLISLFVLGSKAAEIGSVSFEFIMFAMGVLLATPFFASDYMSWAKDPTAERLAWLRTLPIGVPTIVCGRTVALLAALPLNVIAFFTPAWLGGGWGMSAGTFLWFVLAMIGVSLVGAGSTIALEMSIGIRRWIITNIITIAIVLVVIIVLKIWVNFALFEQLARAVEWNGPFVAGMCLVTGMIVLLGCVRLAEQGLRRRELD